MSSMSATLQAILDNPQYHDYLAILKGARNGLVYGLKVRFPHALIMAILFGRGEYVYVSHTRTRPFSWSSSPHPHSQSHTPPHFIIISFSHLTFFTSTQN